MESSLETVLQIYDLIIALTIGALARLPSMLVLLCVAMKRVNHRIKVNRLLINLVKIFILIPRSLAAPPTHEKLTQNCHNSKDINFICDLNMKFDVASRAKIARPWKVNGIRREQFLQSHPLALSIHGTFRLTHFALELIHSM